MTEQATVEWKHVQTFEVTIRHNSEKPILPIDVAIVLKELPLKVSEANFHVKEK